MIAMPCVLPVCPETPGEEDLVEPCIAQQCGRLSNSEFMVNIDTNFVLSCCRTAGGCGGATPVLPYALW